MNGSAAAAEADVVVVGAGPAGLACAIAAARKGLKVEVIDGMKPPIDKACGEGLMPNSLTALVALGFNLEEDFSSCETFVFRGLRFIGDLKANGQLCVAEGAFPEGPGRGIRRTLLHRLLLDRALGLGVRFHWETVVQGITGEYVQANKKNLRARYIVGADGSQSSIAKWANLDRGLTYSKRIGLRQHYAIDPWTDLVEVYWSNRGQAYVTPVSSQEVCVAFVAKDKFDSSEEALSLFPVLKRRLGLATRYDVSRGSVTLGRRLRRVTRGNVALVGDASGSVDAITGEGLALCFRQAFALAQAIQSDNLSQYERAHRGIQQLPSLMSCSLMLLDRSPWLRARSLGSFERNPHLFSSLLNIHVGHATASFFGLDGLLLTGLHILTS